MGITIEADDGTSGQDCTIGCSQSCRELRSQINIDQPGHSIAAEEATASLRTPDNTGIDDRARFNLFIRPDFDAGLNNCPILDNRVIADDRTLEHNRLALDTGRGPDQSTTQLRTFTDIGIVPHDTTINLRSLINNGIVSYRARPMNNCARPDFTIVREIDRPVQLRLFSDLDTLFAPDIATDIPGRNLDIHIALQGISVGTHILTQATYIAPVATRGHIAIDRVAFFEHHGKEFLTKVKLLILLKVGKNLRIEHIDPCINRIAKDFAPTRLFKELRDMPILVGDNDTILQRIMNMCEEKRCQGLLLVMILDQVSQVIIC